MRASKEKLAKVLSLAAGIMYSSWPLGYALNPKVAHTSLASGLEAVHQPYNWVFIAADVTSGILAIATCLLLWSMYKDTKTRKPLITGLVCVVLFAIGTAMAALLPEHCVPNLMVCPSFTQDHFLLVHGAFSLVGSLGLTVALVLWWFQKRRNVLLVALLTAYIIFGAISLIQTFVPASHGNWSQDYYMTLCSVALMCLPACVAIIAPGNKLQLIRN
jgi:uncharacterized membrane protein